MATILKLVYYKFNLDINLDIYQEIDYFNNL